MKILSVFLLSLIATFASADTNLGGIGLPDLIELETQIARDLKDMNDPNEIEEYVQVVRKAHKLRMALFHLMSGKIESFYNAASSLPIDTFTTEDDYLNAQLADLLHFSVESDVNISDARLIDQLSRATQAVAASELFSPAKKLMVEASHFYIRGDSKGLDRVASESGMLSSSSGAFVCGYANMLAGKISRKIDHLEKSVECFKQITDDTIDQTKMFGENPALGANYRNTLELSKYKLFVGRASLHLATSLRLLSEVNESYQVRREYVNAAAIAATQARSNIELLDSPLLWGAAYRVTSEVLDMLYSIESVTSSELFTSKIAQRRDRAYQLSAPYR